MTWDPKSDALKCGYCGATRSVERVEDEIIERPLDDAATAKRGLGGESVRVTECKNCSARITFDGPVTVTRCLYCGSEKILEQSANRNLIRPESLVPLEVSRQSVRENFQKWLRSLWFRPNALKKQKSFEATGIYVPYWTFDSDVYSDWSADAGYYYYETQTVTVMVNGRPQRQQRQVRKVRWVPARGNRNDYHDDWPVAASHTIPAQLARRLGRFQSQGLQPYRPEYLAGWHAEEYQIDLDSGWNQARDEITDEQRRRCSADVPGDTQRNLRVRNRFSDTRWKHVLYPVWSLQYRFSGKVYRVLINGQTGAVAGEAPYSWIKITLAGLTAAGIATGGYILSGRT